MKLVFINRYFYPDESATSQLLTDLACYLADQGHHIEVVCSRQVYTDPKVVLAAKGQHQGITINRVWTSRFGRSQLLGRAMDYLTFYLTACLCLLRVVSRGDTVIAKTDPPLISVIAAMVAWLKGAVLVNWLQDLFPEVAERLGVKGMACLAPVLRRLRNYSLNQARWNVAIGERMAQLLATELRDPASIQVIPNWALFEVTPADIRASRDLRADWGLADHFVVGYSGNMGRGHEFETMMAAAERLQSNRKIIFLLIGDGAWRDWLVDTARSKDLDNIIFKPYQPAERLSASLAVADVHLISLRPELEGLIVPSKFYGIVAAGKPVLFIGDKQGELASLIMQSGNGYSVSVGDSAGLAETIETLCLQTEKRAVCGQRSLAIHDEKLSKRHSHEHWGNVLVR